MSEKVYAICCLRGAAFAILTDYQSKVQYGKDIDLASQTYVEEPEGSQKIHCPMDRYCVIAALDQNHVWPRHRYITTDEVAIQISAGLSIPPDLPSCNYTNWKAMEHITGWSFSTTRFRNYPFKWWDEDTNKYLDVKLLRNNINQRSTLWTRDDSEFPPWLDMDWKTGKKREGRAAYETSAKTKAIQTKGNTWTCCGLATT